MTLLDCSFVFILTIAIRQFYKKEKFPVLKCKQLSSSQGNINTNCTDRFSEELQAVLWPRFIRVLNLNMTSVQETNPHKLGHIDTSPHYVSDYDFHCTCCDSHYIDHSTIC